MAVRKKQLVFTVLILGFISVCMVCVIIYLYNQCYNQKKTEYASPPRASTHVNQDDDEKICMKLEAYQKLVSQSSSQNQNHIQAPIDTVSQRDYRVLTDPLYPPLNRTDTATFQTLQHQQVQRQETSVRAMNDTYRLVGYLVNNDDNQDAGGNKWKLMARMKDRNTSDFYMIPANKNYDIKIRITNDMVVGERLRDIYTIPNNITFTSPLLNKSPYEYVEIEKSDLSLTNGGMFM